MTALFSAGVTLLHAQSKSDTDVTVLEKFQVNDVPIEDNVMPTVRPISSVLGDDRSIIDTPRAVTSVNKAWKDERGIKNAMDYGQFSPGVYSPAQYGVPATPQIRGDLAETYINGERTKFSRNTILPSFNGVEALDIVKGPGSAIYGPQGNGPGGYVNLVTKQPYFDGQHTELSTTLGYLSPGRNYFNPEFTLDTGGPVSDKLAYRVSYLSRYGEGYYLNTRNETQDLFAALTYKASSQLKFDWFAQYAASRFTAVSGLNRVTQDLIDHGTYIAGPAQTLNLFGQNEAANPYFTLLDASQAYRVKIAPYRALVSPIDFVRTKRFQTQLIATADLAGGAKLINLTYLEDRSSNEKDYYGYSALVPKDTLLDDRTEYHNQFRLWGADQKFIAGTAFRYETLTSYQDFSVEPLAPYDLTQPGSTYYYQPYTSTGTFGGFAIPGHPGYSAASFKVSGVQDSKVFDGAAFFQQDLKFTDQLSAVLGLRADRVDATAANPALVGKAYGAFYDASQTVWDGSYFGSLIYKLTPASSLYATYNRVNAITGGSFGGVDASSGPAGLRNAIRALSELYELGFKASVLQNKLYGSVAAFEQTRQRPALVGPSHKVDDVGLELEAVYQPIKAFMINANATFQDATQYGTSFYEQTSSYLSYYPKGFTVDGMSGTGAGSPNYGSYRAPNGKSIAEPGTPRFLGNAFASYQFPSGFGFGVGPQIQGKQNANVEGTLVIPLQVQWNGFVFYRQKTWDVQVSFTNLTNERFYDPIDVTFSGNDLIYARPLITAALTVRYRF